MKLTELLTFIILLLQSNNYGDGVMVLLLYALYCWLNVFFVFKSCGDKVIQEEEVHNNLSLDLHPLLITGLKSFFKVSAQFC